MNFGLRLEEILDNMLSEQVLVHKIGQKPFDDAVAAITSLIKELVAEARINENNIYIRELPRHYFPSGPGEPHIPLVQFHERIAELKAEKEEV